MESFRSKESITDIKIRENLLIGLEVAKNTDTILSTAFFISVILLHELVHFRRYNNKLDRTAAEDLYEYGFKFEQQAFGQRINLGNSALCSKKYHSDFRNLKQEIAI
ncbi:hypothetical protein A8C56_08700 [Niabella ginsenosidivorans]|uniref:Tox-MPTase3 domain-containing protein n=1 Tax=Niabella ginsenosidivorans TaxID=1176587 RepID=A0A1A9I063_9BACT|nr:hypothetical protein [Niabella ginsenosidivorans]ANH81047.1 hypothetical protein A8C56_08700 [Niabella ginsenosidivorans]